jgi:trans-aconitate 2-methyltransferase
MIAHARQLDSEILWLEGDIRRWRAPLPADLISSNAVLQRIPNHESLLLDWVGQLREGGLLAAQIAAPTCFTSQHDTARDLARKKVEFETGASCELFRFLSII